MLEAGQEEIKGFVNTLMGMVRSCTNMLTYILNPDPFCLSMSLKSEFLIVYNYQSCTVTDLEQAKC